MYKLPENGPKPERLKVKVWLVINGIKIDTIPPAEMLDGEMVPVSVRHDGVWAGVKEAGEHCFLVHSDDIYDFFPEYDGERV